MIRKWWRTIGQPYETKAIILMYHRVADLRYDPWQLAVSPALFEQQLRVIRQQWNPLSLSELTQSLTAGSVPDRSVVLTFDDGYIDNFTQAKPLLEQYQIPATFFITTNTCEQQTPFWWDELQVILLASKRLPEQIRLTIAGEELVVDLEGETTLTPSLEQKHHAWVAAEGIATKRCGLYLELWRRMRPLVHGEQQTIMATLRDLAGQVPGTNSGLIGMTPQHLRQLLINPLFSVGAHTVTHPALAAHSGEEQQQEISSSRLYLEELIQKPINLFAYPYGSHTDTTVAVLQKQQFGAAVTTNEGLITKHSQLLRLNRYQVINWRGETFDRQLNQWFRNR